MFLTCMTHDTPNMFFQQANSRNTFMAFSHAFCSPLVTLFQAPGTGIAAVTFYFISDPEIQACGMYSRSSYNHQETRCATSVQQASCPSRTNPNLQTCRFVVLNHAVPGADDPAARHAVRCGTAHTPPLPQLAPSSSPPTSEYPAHRPLAVPWPAAQRTTRPS